MSKRVPVTVVQWLRTALLLSLAAMSVGTGAGTSDIFNCQDTKPSDLCKSKSFDDNDSDGMSDATETNPTNTRLHPNLNPDYWDQNPTTASGSVSNGSIVGGGLNLTNSSGEKCGYFHYIGRSCDAGDKDDWGTLNLIATIETVAEAWAFLHNNHPRMLTGDMSLQGGGPFWNCAPPPPTDHDQHQKGTEVDVRYVRNDNQDKESSTLDLASAESTLYDYSKTMELIGLFESDTRVQTIFVNVISRIPETQKIRQISGHKDHFHVWIRDPEGDGD